MSNVLSCYSLLNKECNCLAIRCHVRGMKLSRACCHVKIFMFLLSGTERFCILCNGKRGKGLGEPDVVAPSAAASPFSPPACGWATPGSERTTASRKASLSNTASSARSYRKHPQNQVIINALIEWLRGRNNVWNTYLHFVITVERFLQAIPLRQFLIQLSTGHATVRRPACEPKS